MYLYEGIQSMVVIQNKGVQSLAVFPALVLFFPFEKDGSTTRAGETNMDQCRYKDIGSE